MLIFTSSLVDQELGFRFVHLVGAGVEFSSGSKFLMLQFSKLDDYKLDEDRLLLCYSLMFMVGSHFFFRGARQEEPTHLPAQGKKN